MRAYPLNIRESENKEVEYIKLKDIAAEIYIAKQKTGFGYKHFFRCPNCTAYRETLYITNTNKVYCRTCSPKQIKKEIYRGINRTTRGGTSEMQYRMSRVATAYNIPLKYPFNYLDVIFNRPKYMRNKKWIEGIYKLQVLENMRNQTIFFNERYEAKLIQQIFEKHLYYYTIAMLKNCFLNWHSLKLFN